MQPRAGHCRHRYPTAVVVPSWAHQTIIKPGDGLEFDAPRKDVAATAAVNAGRFFIQNASSFVPTLALQPQVGDRVLDMCAAPGAKTSHLAALADGQIDIWANDAIKPRLARFSDVERTLGWAASTVLNHPAQYLDKYIEPGFDRILLDAQCSGEGLLDLRHSTAFRYWTMARILKYRRLQTKMLTTAFRLLRPGGVLVYSTCTTAPEENEAPISTLLEREDSARVEPVVLAAAESAPAVVRWEDERFNPAVAGALRLIPDGPFEAFFVCRIRRLGGNITDDDVATIDVDDQGRRASKGW